MQHRARTRAVVSSFVLGFVLPAPLVVAALHLRWIKTHIDPALLTILTLAVAYFLYGIRKLRPLAYGTTEVLIGVFVVFLASRQVPELFKDEEAVWAVVIQLSAGIYIVIRGLDNMSRSPLLMGNYRAQWLFECLWGRVWKE
jgi:hypothetical protein